ncbi:hypothetical protein BDN72DRAFT_852608 [Pluteus cervinus]|uniref:Uncharacterized protein n=1 Tax=Pluteus cervinus TaxID=181527 RepID=A0ACD3BEZ8_9AGAR|nr:hypothetical protein BDN72DRAFT_852608 [Pluteus cervinus]
MAVPTSELDIAIVLGLSTGKSSFAKKRPGEGVTPLQRYNNLRACLCRLSYAPEPEQDVIRSEFCAKYLPATIAHWVEGLADLINAPNPIWTLERDPFFDLILVLHRDRLFLRYLNSRKEIAKPGENLAHALAMRIVILGRGYDPLFMLPESEETRNCLSALFLTLATFRTTLSILFKDENPLPPVASSQPSKMEIPAPP